MDPSNVCIKCNNKFSIFNLSSVFSGSHSNGSWRNIFLLLRLYLRSKNTFTFTLHFSRLHSTALLLRPSKSFTENRAHLQRITGLFYSIKHVEFRVPSCCWFLAWPSNLLCEAKRCVVSRDLKCACMFGLTFLHSFFSHEAQLPWVATDPRRLR